MSRKRTFIVRVNIDDMAAMLAGLDGALEKAEWLDGYMVGVHGHPAREAWPAAKRIGFDFGALHAAEVESFRLEQSERGKASAEKRLEKTGNAQPSRTRTEPPLEPPFEPEVEPIQQSNNPQSNKRTSQLATGGQASRLLLNDWTPDSGHSGICAQRNLSMEMQLERFRSQHGATLDTPEGWSRRFYGWIAQGRPEPIFSPAAAMIPPPIEQWTAHAYEFARTHQPFKREDPDYFWPGELARAKWNSHQAAGWARIVDWKAQLEADCETWNGYERANRKRPAR